jgi:hypothetical protein
MKDAYDFKRKHFPFKSWAKDIWNKDVPPSKSLLAWRLMHGKVPTDDMLMDRDCNIASMCSICVAPHLSHIFTSSLNAILLILSGVGWLLF